MAEHMEVLLVSLPSGLKDAIRSKAKALGSSQSEVIRMCLAASLSDLPPTVNILTVAPEFDKLELALASKDFDKAVDIKRRIWDILTHS